MDFAILLPFLVLIGAMLLMTRSAKNKQRQALAMRNAMEPGTGIRTIGGLYARVKEVHTDTVVVEMAPGVHAMFAKNAVGAVLEDDEYERIVNGDVPDEDTPVVPDDASSLTEEDAARSDATDEDALEPVDPEETRKADEEQARGQKADLTKADAESPEADEETKQDRPGDDTK